MYNGAGHNTGLGIASQGVLETWFKQYLFTILHIDYYLVQDLIKCFQLNINHLLGASDFIGCVSA